MLDNQPLSLPVPTARDALANSVQAIKEEERKERQEDVEKRVTKLAQTTPSASPTDADDENDIEASAMHPLGASGILVDKNKLTPPTARLAPLTTNPLTRSTRTFFSKLTGT